MCQLWGVGGAPVESTMSFFWAHKSSAKRRAARSTLKALTGSLKITKPRRHPYVDEHPTTQPRRASPLFVCPHHALFCLCIRPVLSSERHGCRGSTKLCGLTVVAEPGRGFCAFSRRLSPDSHF